jgi:hypothetical protein
VHFLATAFYACATAGVVSRLLTHLDDHYALWVSPPWLRHHWLVRGRTAGGGTFEPDEHAGQHTPHKARQSPRLQTNWGLRTGWRRLGANLPLTQQRLTLGASPASKQHIEECVRTSLESY